MALGWSMSGGGASYKKRRDQTASLLQTTKLMALNVSSFLKGTPRIVAHCKG